MEHWKIINLWFMKRKLLMMLFISLCIFFFSTCVIFSFIDFKTAKESKSLLLSGTTEFYSQKYENLQEEMSKEQINGGIGMTSRRLLGGPGSWPPRCNSKCGRCTPCRPVHVPVPPGTPVTAEYYPEAWRCKCGNRLYMP